MPSQLSTIDRDLLLQLHHSVRHMLLQDTLDARLRIAAKICHDWGWGYVGIILDGNITPIVELHPDGETNHVAPRLSELVVSNFWQGRFQFMYLQYRKGDGYLLPVSDTANPDQRNRNDVWPPGAVLVFPIFGNASQIVGLLTLSSPPYG